AAPRAVWGGWREVLWWAAWARRWVSTPCPWPRWWRARACSAAWWRAWWGPWPRRRAGWGTTCSTRSTPRPARRSRWGWRGWWGTGHEGDRLEWNGDKNHDRWEGW